MNSTYAKHFIPLESNPDVFNYLMHSLGAPKSLIFEDIWTLEALPPQALAFVLIFPTTESYEERRISEINAPDSYKILVDHDDVVWFKQTINNACGLYSILHALCNGRAQDSIENLSFLAGLVQSPTLQERCNILENSIELEEVYHKAASLGTSEAPNDPTAEVDFHYLCFVRSSKNGHLYELDGDRIGPIDRGAVLEDDFSTASLSAIREYMGSGDINFSLMALNFQK